MKDYFNRENMDDTGAPLQPMYLVEFCLEQLADDTEHCFDDLVCEGLTYEELIGALLTIKRELKLLEMVEEDEE